MFRPSISELQEFVSSPYFKEMMRVLGCELILLSKSYACRFWPKEFWTHKGTKRLDALIESYLRVSTVGDKVQFTLPRAWETQYPEFPRYFNAATVLKLPPSIVGVPSESGRRPVLTVPFEEQKNVDLELLSRRLKERLPEKVRLRPTKCYYLTMGRAFDSEYGLLSLYDCAHDPFKLPASVLHTDLARFQDRDISRSDLERLLSAPEILLCGQIPFLIEQMHRATRLEKYQVRGRRPNPRSWTFRCIDPTSLLHPWPESLNLRHLNDIGDRGHAYRVASGNRYSMIYAGALEPDALERFFQFEHHSEELARLRNERPFKRERSFIEIW